ncbi:MAG: aminotransferase class V-fold PLP-dependent enzyme [Candidatus Promineifilaceae bacterium]|nr:aminotransferase class V-fold PLP-dependent enzyme [Candidatus Promineifilaceae bacterium]
MSDDFIYMDHGATTPVDPAVVEAMLPYWTELYGNPSSVHRAGREAQRALEGARRQVADLLGAQPAEIVFTGCGSESDNLALRGVLWAAPEGRNHLITSVVEHKAVLDTALQLQEQAGIAVTVLPVDEHGQVRVADVEAAIRPETALISIMAANNEIGSLQPVAAIGELARERKILFHTDAIQAAASTDWNLSAMPYDLVSLAPHKFYGPKGIGILYVRHGVTLQPALTGGSQEEGRRAGTSNVPYAIGAAKALRLAAAHREENVAHYRRLRDRLIEGVLEAVPEGARLTGHPVERLPHNASFAFQRINGNDLLIQLDMAGVAASSGSACLTGSPEPSRVLEAIGLDQSWAMGGLRLTVGRQNTMAEAERVIAAVARAVETMRTFAVQYS